MDIYGGLFEDYEIKSGVCEHSCYGDERAILKQVVGVVEICNKCGFEISERWQIDEIICLLAYSPIVPKDIQGLELLRKLLTNARIEVGREQLPELDAEIRQVLCEYLINTYFKPNTNIYNPDREGVSIVLSNLKRHYEIRDRKAVYKKVYAKGLYKVLESGKGSVAKCECIYDIITYIDKDLWVKGKEKVAKDIDPYFKYNAVKQLLKR